MYKFFCYFCLFFLFSVQLVHSSSSKEEAEECGFVMQRFEANFHKKNNDKGDVPCIEVVVSAPCQGVFGEHEELLYEGDHSIMQRFFYNFHTKNGDSWEECDPQDNFFNERGQTQNYRVDCLKHEGFEIIANSELQRRVRLTSRLRVVNARPENLKAILSCLNTQSAIELKFLQGFRTKTIRMLSSGDAFLNLRELILRGSGLTLEDFKILCNGRFPSLSDLYLYDNKLGSPIFEAIINSGFSDIAVLELSKNEIGYGEEPSSFTLKELALPNIKKLYLGQNFLGKWLTLKSHSALSELYLSGSGIHLNGVRDLAAGKFGSLRVLDLANNNLGRDLGLALRTAGFITTLEELYLRNNDLQAEGIEYFEKSHFSNLILLDLSDNALGSEGFSRFLSGAALPKLEVLSAEKNDLHSESIEAFSRITFLSLNTLDLGSNKLGAKGVKYLNSIHLPSLKRLDIEGNQVRGPGVDALTGIDFPNLEELNVRWNTINRDEVDRLKLHFPKAEIFHQEWEVNLKILEDE